MPSVSPNSLDAFWMPFTNNRHFKREPRLLARAKGMYYEKPNGDRVFDGTGGLWCVNAGHCHPRIVEAIARQAGEMDFAPTFQLGHPLAFELASRLVSEMPAGFEQIFFTNSGSEAVDSALKIASAYQRAIGQGGRTRLIGRERGYHGTNFGGTAVGGIVGNRRAFGALLAGVDHLPHTHLPANVHARGRPPHGAELVDALERMIGLHGADTIAAVIVEPVAGSTGVLPPPVGYLERLREITAANGILLIFDKVITGFCRMGTTTAAEAYSVTPDLITLAKAITNAAVPMGAVAVRGHVYDAMMEHSAPGIELATGYTYSGHPLACAAALATLDVYRDEGIYAHAAAIMPVWAEAVHGLADARHVIDVRSAGIIAGIELKPREGAAPGARAMAAFHKLFDTGTLVRVTGETIALSPPLVISEEETHTLVGAIRGVLAGLD